MRNGAHAKDDVVPGRRALWRRGGSRLTNPDSRLDVQGAASHDIADLLQIGEPVQLDVVHTEAPVGDRGRDRFEFERLLSLIQLEIKVGVTLQVGARDEIEARALPGSGQIGEQAEVVEDGRVVWSFPDRRDAELRIGDGVRGELGKRLGKRCHIFPPFMKIKELNARPDACAPEPQPRIFRIWKLRLQFRKNYQLNLQIQYFRQPKNTNEDGNNLRVQLLSVRASKENCKPILLRGTADCFDCSSGGATAATIMSARSIQLTATMARPRRQRVRRPSKAWPPRVLALVARADLLAQHHNAREGWRNHVLVLFFLCSHSSAMILRWPPSTTSSRL